MRFKPAFIFFIFALLMHSCSYNNEFEEISLESSNTSDYISLSLNMEKENVNTRDLGPGEDSGTNIDSYVHNLKIITLNNNNQILDNIRFESYEISEKIKEAIKVHRDTRYLFVMANVKPPIDSILNKRNTTFSNFNELIKPKEVEKEIAKGEWLMSSVGNSPHHSGWIKITPFSAKSSSKEDIDAAKLEATTNKVEIRMNRIAAKVIIDLKSQDEPQFIVKGGAGRVIGYEMNTTNRTFYPHSELVNYSVPSPHIPAQYRVDPNWDNLTMEKNSTGEIVGTAVDAFNWLGNQKRDWRIYGCFGLLENTMSKEAQNYNNTTKVALWAKYTPNGLGIREGNSWFRMKGIIYSFETLKALYEKATTPQSVKDELDAFYAHMIKKPSAKFAEAEIFKLDKIERGGYIAAQKEPYVIEFFQKSTCYYEVLIKHDNRVPPFGLGRWGVVRNNSYTIKFKSISRPGLPYFPDPTDPSIKDPANPDPLNPIPNDQFESGINVTIAVEPWEPWKQESDL